MKTAKSNTSKRPAPAVESFASVWDALADTPEQAANLRARSELMRQITAIVKESNWTQTEAAQRCGVTQPRRPLVVSCGTQQSELVIVVEPGGHVGRLHLSLSTCPRGGCQEHGIERW
ncbi:MAG: XRE family transcriptional regulator, partial [Rubrivivax sp.]|nr:XRE family transcriptional regulator [Rubrivivax sp.]